MRQKQELEPGGYMKKNQLRLTTASAHSLQKAKRAMIFIFKKHVKWAVCPQMNSYYLQFFPSTLNTDEKLADFTQVDQRAFWH